jgi:hypothetical protein
MCTQVKSCLFVLCKQSDRVCAQLLYCEVGRTITISTGGLFVCLCLHTNEHMYSNCLHKVSKDPNFKFVCLTVFCINRAFFIKGDFLGFFLFMFVIHHCFICRPSDFHSVGGCCMVSNPGLLGHATCNRALQSS